MVGALSGRAGLFWIASRWGTGCGVGLARVRVMDLLVVLMPKPASVADGGPRSCQIDWLQWLICVWRLLRRRRLPWVRLPARLWRAIPRVLSEQPR